MGNKLILKKKKAADVGGDRSNSITAKLIQKKREAAENKNTKNNKNNKNTNQKNKPKSVANKPRKGKKGYSDMMEQFEEDIVVDVDLEKQKEIAKKKALRMNDGEKTLAEKTKRIKSRKETC